MFWSVWRTGFRGGATRRMCFPRVPPLPHLCTLLLISFRGTHVESACSVFRLYQCYALPTCSCDIARCLSILKFLSGTICPPDFGADCKRPPIGFLIRGDILIKLMYLLSRCVEACMNNSIQRPLKLARSRWPSGELTSSIHLVAEEGPEETARVRRLTALLEKPLG